MKRFFSGNSTTGILGFLVFAIMGTGLLGNVALSTWRSYDSLSWPDAEGRVLSSNVVAHVGGANSRNSSYVPTVRYEFKADGQRYTGERLAFGFGNRSPEVAQSLVRRFRPNGHVRVFYDPADHSRSVLMPGFHGKLWFGWLAGFLFLAAAFIMRWYDAWFRQRRARQQRNQGST